jgi:acetyl esterase/lipase
LPLHDEGSDVMRELAMAVAMAALAVGSLAACEPTKEGIWVDPVYPVVRYDDLAYATVRDEDGQLQTLHLDLYAPGDDPRTKRPVVVWAHGGSFTSGDKTSMRWIPEALAARGFVVASIEYRLREDMSPVRFPLSTQELIAIIEAKEDMQGAVRWLKAAAPMFKLDPTRVSVAGYSAGAVMALITATTADVPGGSGTRDQTSIVCTAVSVSGAGSSIFIDPSDAGALLLHGDRDTTVPYAEAKATYDAMVADDLAAELVTYAGVGHGVPADRGDDLIVQSSAWLKEQMVDRAGGCG